jgi:hypothetical protein
MFELYEGPNSPRAFKVKRYLSRVYCVADATFFLLLPKGGSGESSASSFSLPSFSAGGFSDNAHQLQPTVFINLLPNIATSSLDSFYPPIR